jgi:anti-anti-sigma factor
MAVPFAVDVRDEDGARVLHLTGEFDVATADLDLLADAVHDTDAMVVVDMAAVTFIDSAGLGLLVGFQSLVNQQGRAFAIRRPTRHIERVLAVSGLDRVLGTEAA